MTAKTTRILKEARPLFWPWCVVVLACMIPRIFPGDPLGPTAVFGFSLGIPLLATLPFGNEFQNRTLSLLLSQPVGRMEIWWEKLGVTVVAVLSIALVIYSRGVTGPLVWVVGGTWMIATIASAAFWTLLARSTLGGVVLNIAAGLFIGATVFLVYWQSGYSSQVSSVLTQGIVLLCYAGVMLWLGRRKLARFQVVGGMAGDDLLMAGPDVMPGVLAGWLRCRPTGAVLNLIRKELRLLRPVWLITLLATPGWICLTLYGLMHERGSIISFTSRVPSAKWPDMVWIVGVCSTLIIAMLAGSLSLGEERTSGTHAWHMTLPVSALRQWLIKLFIALFAGLVGAVLLPMLLLIAGGSLAGSPFMFVDLTFGKFWLLVVALLTFTSFWCACAANGTVRAVLWVFPMLIAIGLACVFGEWAGRELVHLLVARFGLFASFRFTFAVSRLGPKVTVGPVSTAWNHMTDSVRAAVVLRALILVPALLFAVVQSYRLFRAQLQDRALSVVRSLLPLSMTAFLCSFSLLAYHTFEHDATKQKVMFIFGTNHAIEEILRVRALEKTLPSAANPEGTEALQLTGEDLLKASPEDPRLPSSESARRWLRNARITVNPNKDHPNNYCCGKNAADFSREYVAWYYSATIHLADGTDLTESYEPVANQNEPFGHYSVYAHWPGAKGQESLWER